VSLPVLEKMSCTLPVTSITIPPATAIASLLPVILKDGSRGAIPPSAFAVSDPSVMSPAGSTELSVIVIVPPVVGTLRSPPPPNPLASIVVLPSVMIPGLPSSASSDTAPPAPPPLPPLGAKSPEA
jgi:hypothetical protein